MTETHEKTLTQDAPAVGRPRQGISRIWSALSGFAGLTGVVLLMFVPSVHPRVTRLDHWTADWRTAYLSPRADTQNAQVAVVTITDETLRNVVSSPVDRGLLADIVAAIDAAGAKAIGLDILFLKPTDASKDARLVEVLKTARVTVILGALDERGDLLPFQRAFQTEFLAKTGRVSGYVNLRHETDGVVRFTASPAPGSATPKSFARLMAEAADPNAVDDAATPIPWMQSARDGKPALLALPAEMLLGAAGPDEAKLAAGVLKDRIVFVGGNFPFRDQHRVPLSVRTGQSIPGLMIQATITAGLLAPQYQIAEISPIMVRLLLAATALSGMAMGYALRRQASVASLEQGFAVVVLLALDAICFTQLRILLPFTLAVTAWVAGLASGRFFGAELRP